MFPRTLSVYRGPPDRDCGLWWRDTIYPQKPTWEMLGKKVFSDLTFLPPLISGRYLPLAGFKWKPQWKRALDVARSSCRLVPGAESRWRRIGSSFGQVEGTEHSHMAFQIC